MDTNKPLTDEEKRKVEEDRKLRESRKGQEPQQPVKTPDSK